MFKKHIFYIVHLKINNKANVQLSSGQVVRDCVLVIIYVCNPIIGTCILYIEQVEQVESEPNVLEIAEESAVHNGIRPSCKLVGKTEVHAFVGRCAEITFFIACTRSRHGKSAGQDAFQVQLDTFVTGEIILEKERNVIPLAVWHRYIFATPDALLRFHQGEADPGVRTRNKFAEEFDVDAHCMALRAVLAVITDLDIIHRVGVQVIQFLVIHVGTDFEVPAGCPEGIIAAGNDMDGALGFQLIIQLDDAVAVFVLYGRTQFLVERRLVIQSGSQAEGQILVEIRNETE